MHITEEKVYRCYLEMDALMADYFRRENNHDGMPPLEMDWPVYMQMNEQGILKLYTAENFRHDLVGFVMYYIHPHLHHKGVTVASSDILAVHLDMRGKGVGKALLEYAEPRLKELGVKFIAHRFRTAYDVEPLFPKLGYNLIERGYLKDIR